MDITAADLQHIIVGQHTSTLERAQLVDVREGSELLKANFPAGGSGEPLMRHLPLSEFDDWSDDVEDILDRTKPVVVACAAGVRSMKVGHWLHHKAGFEQVYTLCGGLMAFSRANSCPSGVIAAQG
jgi:rhodanese-related sulfurtransferase